MKLHDLKAARGSRKKTRRVGRGLGSTQGKTAGRGIKGQGSRSGSSKSPGFEGGQNPLTRRLPKRGFSNRMFKKQWEVVNLSTLEKIFKKGGEVDVEALKKNGLVSGKKLVKVLANGDIKAKLNVKVDAYSKTAKEKIEKAGGKAELLEAKKS